MVNVATFNVRTLNTINKQSELTAFAVKQNINIIWVQEYKYYHNVLELWYHDSDNIGGYSVDWTHLTVNDFTNYNVVFIFVSDWK